MCDATLANTMKVEVRKGGSEKTFAFVISRGPYNWHLVCFFFLSRMSGAAAATLQAGGNHKEILRDLGPDGVAERVKEQQWFHLLISGYVRCYLGYDLLSSLFLQLNTFLKNIKDHRKPIPLISPLESCFLKIIVYACLMSQCCFCRTTLMCLYRN